jgi:DNA-binding CsgD family transcriptional regulator/tetratricopeptide (TPR) repeat protein
MELLERTEQLGMLSAAFHELRNGAGRVVLLSGEAGIGKTALVEHFVRMRCAAARVLRGGCDALFTPRPLGPLYDIAVQIQPDLLALLNAGCDWRATIPTILGWLQAPECPTVMVIEDAHWADEATLDLLKFLGRRIHQTHTLLIITYRDDELDPQHPLRLLLGDLPLAHTTRIALPPLSEAAVETLAQQAHRPAAGVYTITAGNPFFVTEVLGHAGASVPATVRDTVLARVARLAPAARTVLELASVVPGALERWVVAVTLQPDIAAIDECLERGLLRLDTRGLAFRHELARRAVESALSPARAQALHAQILRALIDHDAERAPLARLVHHAVCAADAAAVLQFAPRAAQQASASGAHREAATHYATALRYADDVQPNMIAQLLEGRSYECYLTGLIGDAIQARREVMAIWQRIGSLEREGDTMRWLSRLYWFAGNTGEAIRYADAAITLLEQAPAGEALAMAYSNRSQLHMLAEEYEPTQRWGARALALADLLGATEVRVHTLTNIGTAALRRGYAAGRAQLEAALELAHAHKWHDHVARVYASLISLTVQERDYARAIHYLDTGLSYTTARDLDSYSGYFLGWQARLHFEQGQWAAAEADARRSLQMQHGASVLPIPALIVLGHLRVRRGEPDQGLLDQARDLALPTGEPQRIGPLAAARAEAAWWRGDIEQTCAEAQIGYESVRHGQDRWMLGQLIFWMWRAGGLTEVPERLPEPFALLMQGQWQAAASAWERIGAPFEQALALATGDEAAQLAALAIFDRLGAEPAARLLRRDLRAAGVRRIPRGPRATTRDNPLGLTRRECEVLTLLAEGRTNVDIGARLAITPKTTDHHVAAILAKLGVHTRGEAVAVAHRHNLIP